MDSMVSSLTLGSGSERGLFPVERVDDSWDFEACFVSGFEDLFFIEFMGEIQLYPMETKIFDELELVHDREIFLDHAVFQALFDQRSAGRKEEFPVR